MQITTLMKEKTAKDLLTANANTIAKRLLALPKSEVAIDHEEVDQSLAQIDFSKVEIDTDVVDPTETRRAYKEEQHKKLLNSGERQLYKFLDFTSSNTTYDALIFDSRFHVFMLQQLAKAFCSFNEEEQQQAGKLQTVGKWWGLAKNALVTGTNAFKELTEFLADDEKNTPIHIEATQFIILAFLITELLNVSKQDGPGPGKLSLKYGLLNVMEDKIGTVDKLAADALIQYKQSSTHNINNNNESLLKTAQSKQINVSDPSENLNKLIKKMLHFQMVLSTTVDSILQKIDELTISLPKKKALAAIVLHVVGKYFENPYSEYLIYQPQPLARKLSQSGSEIEITMEETDSFYDDSASLNSSLSNSSDISSFRKGSANQPDKNDRIVTVDTKNTHESQVHILPQSVVSEGDASATTNVRKGSAPKELFPPPSLDAPPSAVNRKATLRRTIETFTPIDSSPKVQKQEEKAVEPSDSEIITERSQQTKAVIEAILSKYEGLFKNITDNMNAIHTIKYNCQKLYEIGVDDGNERNNQPVSEAEYIHIQALRADLAKLIHCQQNVLINHSELDNLATKYSSVEKAEVLFSNGIDAYKNILNMRLKDLNTTINDLTLDGYGQENTCIISKKIKSLTDDNRKLDGLIANINTDTTTLENDNSVKRQIIKNNNNDIEDSGKLLQKMTTDHEQVSKAFKEQKELLIDSVINVFNRRFTYKTYLKENFIVVDKSNDEIAQNIAKRFWDGIPILGWIINKCTGENQESRLTAAQHALSLIQEINAGRAVNNNLSGFLTPEKSDEYSKNLSSYAEKSAEYLRRQSEYKQNIDRLNDGNINLTGAINQNNTKIGANNSHIINYRAAIQRNTSKIEKLDKVRKQIEEIKDKLSQPNSDMFSALNVARDLSNEMVAANKPATYRLVN